MLKENKNISYHKKSLENELWRYSTRYTPKAYTKIYTKGLHKDIHQRPTQILISVQLLCQGTILNTENSFFKGFYNNRRIYRERPATITK
jgi:hypothetical protein